MSAHNTGERVLECVVEVLGAERATTLPSSRLKEDLGADSLDAIELTMSVEDEFGIEILDDVAAKIITVGDLTATVERQLEGRVNA